MKLVDQIPTTHDLDLELDLARQRYTSANPNSYANYRSACKVMPGGNTRTVLHYSPFPITVVKGDGAYITDSDGHVYCDFLCEYTAGLYGHNNEVIKQAVVKALNNGTTLGGPNLEEARLAKLMCKRFPAVERIRFCNSGTESNILALSAARAYSKRSDILIVDGSYHGSVLSFHGSNPLNLPFPIHKMTYNQTDQAVELINSLGTRLAAVLIEPMIGAGGGIPATVEFLSGLRDATAQTGALLIFDEVMTSRLTGQGLHGHFKIKPDLVTFGKYIGGGMTFGAFGGRARIIDRFDPARSDAWSHAGTFNNNILTMAAGFAGLDQVYTSRVADAFFSYGNDFRNRLVTEIAALKLPVHVTGMGSMMTFHFAGQPPTAPPDPVKIPAALLELIHLDMIELRQYYARRGMINLSLPMTDANLNEFLSRFLRVLQQRSGIIESISG